MADMNVIPARAFDEHRWIDRQVAALRDGRLDDLDRDHLIEALTDMAGRDLLQLESRLAVLFQHLLKIDYQPQRLTRSWVATVLVQQDGVERLLRRLRSLQARAGEVAIDAYRSAVRRAAFETDLPAATFPSTCPWTVVEALAYRCPAVPERGRYRLKG